MQGCGRRNTSSLLLPAPGPCFAVTFGLNAPARDRRVQGRCGQLAAAACRQCRRRLPPVGAVARPPLSSAVGPASYERLLVRDVRQAQGLCVQRNPCMPCCLIALWSHQVLDAVGCYMLFDDKESRDVRNCSRQESYKMWSTRGRATRARRAAAAPRFAGFQTLLRSRSCPLRLLPAAVAAMPTAAAHIFLEYLLIWRFICKRGGEGSRCTRQ